MGLREKESQALPEIYIRGPSGSGLMHHVMPTQDLGDLGIFYTEPETLLPG